MIAEGFRAEEALRDGPCVMLWPGEQPWFGDEECDDLLRWAADNGVSDVRLEPSKPVRVQRHGRLLRATKAPLDLKASERAATKLFRAADAMAHLKEGRSFSVAYEPGVKREWNATVDETKRYRFRINCANALQWGNDGPAIIVRPLPGTPRDIDTNHPEPQLLEFCRPSTGMVIVGGVTGSGKSDLMSGMVLRELRDPAAHVAILEIGAPIEHVYDGLEGPTASISQVEIGRHLKTFADAIHFAVRGNFDVIVVTECRDAETMVAAIQAASKGHRVLLTMHGNTLFEVVEGAVSMCPANIRSEMTIALAQALRLIVVQRLVWSTDGTRTPIREMLPCPPEIREALTIQPAKFWPTNLRLFCKQQHLDFGWSLKRAFEEGRITADIFAKESAKIRE